MEVCWDGWGCVKVSAPCPIRECGLDVLTLSCFHPTHSAYEQRRSSAISSRGMAFASLAEPTGPSDETLAPFAASVADVSVVPEF